MELDSLAIYKSSDGIWRWAALTSAAMWDLQDELVTRKAMDFAVAYATITGDRGPLRHEHIPGLDVGICERQMRAGDYLFEAGSFYDTPFAQAARKRYQEQPGLYKVSAGLRFKESDFEDGVYRRVVIFERSATKSPAVPITSLGVQYNVKGVNKEMQRLTESQLKEVAAWLGSDWSLEDVRALCEGALEAGITKSHLLEKIKAYTGNVAPDLVGLIPKPSPFKPMSQMTVGDLATVLEATVGDLAAVLGAILTAALTGQRQETEAEKSHAVGWAAVYDQFTSRMLNPGMPQVTYKGAQADWAARYDQFTSRTLNPGMPVPTGESFPVVDYDHFTSKRLNRGD